MAGQSSSSARTFALLAAVAAAALLVLDGTFVAHETGLVGGHWLLNLSPVALGYSIAGFDAAVPWLMGWQILFAVAVLVAAFGVWRAQAWGRAVIEVCAWVALPYLAFLLIVWVYGVFVRFPQQAGGELGFVFVAYLLVAFVIVAPLILATGGIAAGGLVAIRALKARSRGR